jgi:hypothetical protein
MMIAPQVELRSAASVFIPRLAPGRYPIRGLGARIFLSCWMVYVVHVATNTVREIYPALAIADHFSFRVDEYANLHPDLFEKPGYGWHINSNPGASMLAAVPYALARPLIDRVVARVNASRHGATPPEYHSPWPMAREFYQAAWRRGLDVKFGLAALVMQAFCMAPISAAGVVAMFYLLRHLSFSDRAAVWLAFLYGFGTPVFFRTGSLNHNMILGHVAFLGMLAVWNPGRSPFWSASRQCLAAGLAAGLAVLLDYSGIVVLPALGFYALLRAAVPSRPGRISSAAVFLAGAAVPICMLWFYQWQSFGNPFLPAQNWIHVQWVDTGYRGLSLPRSDLLWSNLLSFRFGLLTSCPLLLLALAAPLVRRRPVPSLEMSLLLGIPVAFWLFSSSVAYARLQFNTGIRYMAPVLPFLFVAVALVMDRLPLRMSYGIAVVSIAQAWAMAMYRDVERGFGVLDPLLHVLLGGFQLPLLTTLSRIDGPQMQYFRPGVSPLPLFTLAACLLFGLWTTRLDKSRSSES